MPVKVVKKSGKEPYKVVEASGKVVASSSTKKGAEASARIRNGAYRPKGGAGGYRFNRRR